MKRFFAIILSVLAIALIIYGVNSYRNSEKTPPQKPEENVQQNIPMDNPGIDKNESEDYPQTAPNPSNETTVYTGVGIYQGKIDSNFIEVLLDGNPPLLLSFTLSPDVSKEFSSIKPEEGDVISFEYKTLEGQYLITKILR